MGTSDSKASVAIRAFGKAFGFIGRIVTPSSYSFKWKKNKPKDVRVKQGVSQKDTLELEIEKIELGLDSVYRRIAQGATLVRQDKTGTGSAELDELLKRSHELKDSLRAKRIELSRLERQAARNFRFQLSVSSGKEQDTEQEERISLEQGASPERTHLNPKLARAIQSAVKKASFVDDSKRIVFENIIRDILEGDAELRRAAVSNLSELKGSSVHRVLTLLLDDPDNRVCAAALNSLSVIGEPVSAAIFIKFIDSREDYLRLAALRGLARIGRPEDASVFVNHLEDRHPAIRKAAATYLGWRREKSAIRRLIRALYDADGNVRAAAATSLGHIRDDRAVMSLIRTLGDDDATVRKASKAAIEMILNDKIEVEIDTLDPKTQVEEIKDWWRSERIDMQLAIRSAKYATSTNGHVRDDIDAVSDLMGEKGQTDGEPMGRSMKTKDSKRLSERMVEKQKEPVEEAYFRAKDSVLRAPSTVQLERPAESSTTTDKPITKAEEPGPPVEGKKDREATDTLENFAESDAYDKTTESTRPSQTEVTSREGADEGKPISSEVQDASGSLAQFNFDEMDKPQVDAEKPSGEGEVPLYQESLNDFSGLDAVAEVNQTSGKIDVGATEQSTKESGTTDNMPDHAATDKTKTADESASEAASEEEGLQDFGLDDLGIKVNENDKESPAQADSEESSEVQDESESGDNEEYDFLLDS